MKNYGQVKGRCYSSNYELEHEQGCKCLTCQYTQQKEKKRKIVTLPSFLAVSKK